MNACLESVDLAISFATSFEDRCDAFRLTHAAYVEAGLGSPAPSGFRVTPYQLLPESRILLTRSEGEAIATVSLIPDSDEGVPMESIYPQELNRLRDQGFWFAEVGCLADRRRDHRRFIANFCNMTRLMAQYADVRGVDGFVIAVHPRHAKFYKAYMCFEEIGGVTEYPLVQNRPAIALLLDFAKARENSPQKYSQFFGDAYPPEKLCYESGQMPPGQAEYFSQFVGGERQESRELLSA